MRNHFTKINVDWLVDGKEVNTDFDIEVSEEHIEYPLQPEMGRVHACMLKTSHSISAYKSYQHYNADVTGPSFSLGDFSVEFETDTLMMQVVDGTTVRQKESFSDIEILTSPGLASFRHAREYVVETKHETAVDFIVAVAAISVSSLDLLIGEKNRENMLIKMNMALSPSATSHPITMKMNNILLDAVNPKLQGDLKLLYAQSKVLEFICELQEFIQQYSSKPITSKRSLLKVHELHDYLSNLEGSLPSLATLAQEANMSLRNLNRAFMDEFGMTVYGFITKKRLQDAHEAMENSAISQKVLAARLDYSHVNNFITAFKREFGYAPGALRKIKK